MYGAGVLVAVPEPAAVGLVRWIALREALPHYWLLAFPDELHGW